MKRQTVRSFKPDAQPHKNRKRQRCQTFLRILAETAPNLTCFLHSSAEMNLVCPKPDECPADQQYWKQANTFVAHWAECHLTIAEVDFTLDKLLDDYDGTSNCPLCDSKNKFRNRAKLLGHICHKHCSEKQLKWIQNAFMPKSKENSVSSAAEMDVVAEAVEARMAGKTLSLAAVKGINKKPRRQQEDSDTRRTATTPAAATPVAALPLPLCRSTHAPVSLLC
jgi:hypothetical protein